MIRARRVFALALVMTLPAASCGGDDSPAAEPITTISTSTTSTTAAPTPSEADLVGQWTAGLGTWTFNADGSYSLEGAQSDSGRWRFSESQQSITLTTFSGDFCDERAGGSFDIAFSADRNRFTLDLKSDDCERLIFNTLTWQRQ